MYIHDRPNYGWICPRCETVHAPHVPVCYCHHGYARPYWPYYGTYPQWVTTTDETATTCGTITTTQESGDVEWQVRS